MIQGKIHQGTIAPGSLTARPLVFLHIPKTAGQTIHHALAHAVGGADYVSPVRVHSQVARGQSQMPPGYRLYSGHIDWTDLGQLDAPFTFTVLRDPRERIASFYFYMRKEAEALAAKDPAALEDPARRGMREVLARSADDYFLGGDAPWERFIADNYDNFYVTYFATGSFTGSRQMAAVPAAEAEARALTALRTRIDGVYGTNDLARLEADLSAGLNTPLAIAGRFANVGAIPRRTKRWPLLMERLEKDASRAGLESFAARDQALLDALGMALD